MITSFGPAAWDLGSGSERSGGSSPLPRTDFGYAETIPRPPGARGRRPEPDAVSMPGQGCTPAKHGGVNEGLEDPHSKRSTPRFRLVSFQPAYGKYSNRHLDRYFLSECRRLVWSKVRVQRGLISRGGSNVSQETSGAGVCVLV